MPLMLEALAGVAELNLQTGSYEQASELSSFIRTHPSSTHETRDRADRIVRCTRGIPDGRTDPRDYKKYVR